MYPTLALNSLDGFEDDLELQVFLPPPLKYWCVPPYLVYSTLIRASTWCMLAKHSVFLSPMLSPVILSVSSVSVSSPPQQCVSVCGMHMYMGDVHICVLHVDARGGHWVSSRITLHLIFHLF